MSWIDDLRWESKDDTLAEKQETTKRHPLHKFIQMDTNIYIYMHIYADVSRRTKKRYNTTSEICKVVRKSSFQVWRVTPVAMGTMCKDADLRLDQICRVTDEHFENVPNK